ncbi:MAG: hypothetical protein GF364_14755 [Candidatus Lokiarchaeota archaeon]|nr:hypothetical protein [Candidatus Lokiarchaeota archaeon]
MQDFRSQQDPSHIPYKDLQNWSHKRIKLSKEPVINKKKRYENQNKWLRLGDKLLKDLVKFIDFSNISLKWSMYKVIMHIIGFFFKIHNRIKLVGKENIPKNGAIFIANHQGAQDPIILLSAFKKPVSIFTDVGNGFIADFLENTFGFVCRRGINHVMIEKMIRTILLKNCYFAIWPEGHPPTEDGSKVGYGFSGIAKVYATINSKKNILPIVPVIFQGAESYWWGTRRKAKQIKLTICRPYYLPREWLKPPKNGGKSPRELINFIMENIANRFGQKNLITNRLLEKRRTARGKPW